MKNKGTITFFAIALAIVCLFHLSFTVRTAMIESRAEKITNGDKELMQQYLDSISHKTVYNVLVKKYTYAECKERELNLGLDLRGGMHITLEVAMEDLLREMSGNNQDKVFQEAIILTKEKRKGGQRDFMTLFSESVKEIDPNADLSVFFATLENKDEISLGASPDKVLAFLKRESKSALSSTFEVLRKRIDRFGVTQPNIQLLEGSERILIELPGVDDPERVRRLLQGAAKLEFWETYENKEILPYMEDVNKVLSARISLEQGIDVSDKDTARKEKDDFFSAPVLTEEQKENQETEPLLADIENDTLTGDSVLAEDEKSDEQLTPEEIERKYPLYRYLAPALNRTEEGTFYVQGPVVGTAFFYDTAKINRFLSYPEVKAVLPPDAKFAWSANPIDQGRAIYQLIALRITTLDRTAPLDGKVVTNARVDVSPLGEREVSLSMNAEGAKRWERLTEANIQRSIAIVLDGLVRSFPTVQTKIAGGNSQITGGFSSNEAQDLANILNSGKLDVGIIIIEEAIVGPSLGRTSITKGMLSLIVGLILVLVFMIIYYNRSGWVANLALAANIFFIFGILASLGAALTLPGIAGIVLTIGMSVDANVLIFERIREEIAAGKGIRLAIKEGYLKAYSAIIDANLTTLFVGIILYTFGQGPIHGFAIILIIGILSSLFSAILITRIVFDTLLNKEKPLRFSTSLSEKAFNNININFLGIRKYAYVVSAFVITIGLVSISVQGLKYGVDFKGGFSYVISFNQDVNPNNITIALTNPLNGQPEVKTFGPRNQVKITTAYLLDSDLKSPSDSVEGIIVNTLSEKFPELNPEILSSQQVGPAIADDIKISALLSIVFSMLVIFLYIFIRFRKWQYALAATITPFHDVLLILGIFSLFQNVMPFSLEIDQAFIAALLTIIGYSINDTVVVFDRIREKLGLIRHRPFFETINLALNETLSRTLITSLTTLLVVVILFVFGGEIIRGFSFALLIGILVGTYSSIFVSTPILVEFSKKELQALRESQATKKM